MGINVYPQYIWLHKLYVNVHVIYTDHMIFFTLVVTKSPNICFDNI